MRKQKNKNNNLSKMTQERKASATYYEVVILDYVGASQKSFNLTCPFIPDRVEIQAAVGYETSVVNNSAPLQPFWGVTGDQGTNVYVFQLSCLPAGRLMCCNGVNSFNPVCRFDNVNRSYFQGSYQLDCGNSSDWSGAGRLYGGQAILSFTYYKD